MKAANLIVGVASAAGAAGVIFAAAQLRAAHQTEETLQAARQRHAALEAQVATRARNVREAEKRAVAAERDTAELLGAVNSLRAQPVALTAAEIRAGRRTIDSERAAAGSEAIDGGLVRAEHKAAATPDAATAALQARMGGGVPKGGIVGMVQDAKDPRDQERLAQERAYQQELAKKRAEQAMDKAKFDEATHALEPATRYQQLVDRARAQAAVANFAFAIRTFNEAMTAKPPELPLSPDVTELQALLQAQNQQIDVTLVSDGETYVSIANARSPAKFMQTVVKLLPGNYEVVGRRRGYREVRMVFQVRAGVLAPMVSAICTQPDER